MKSRINYALAFLFVGVLALLATLVFGLTASIVYIDPKFYKEFIPFNRMRPLHVSNAIAWIVLTATGGLYYYLSLNDKWNWRFPRLIALHFWLFLTTGIAI